MGIAGHPIPLIINPLIIINKNEWEKILVKIVITVQVQPHRYLQGQ